ncbi:MAG: YceI family protein, partial [Melioribacter sp.]|nr:YceI family protein [Melioribacter sp.]
MNKFLLSFLTILFVSTIISSQGFKVKAAGTQTFNFEDKNGRNQASFFSATPLEDITGTGNAVSGSVSFDVANFTKTLKGKISVKVSSINTGIDLRNHHLQSSNWLYADKYPEISFEIVSVNDVKQTADNRLEFNAKGKFSMHGVTKEVIANVDATYLDENDQTRKRAPGDLFGVRSKFNINLSDYDVDNALIGNKVAEKIEISINIVGSN